jgi:Vacuolar protein sorting 55
MLNILHCIIYTFHYPRGLTFDRVPPPSPARCEALPDHDHDDSFVTSRASDAIMVDRLRSTLRLIYDRLITIDGSMLAVIFLSFMLAVGFLLIILSCALWNNWLPLIVGE